MEVRLIDVNKNYDHDTIRTNIDLLRINKKIERIIFIIFPRMIVLL